MSNESDEPFKEYQKYVLKRVFRDFGFSIHHVEILVEDVCHTTGITCNAYGEVIGLGPASGLDGILSEALGELLFLQSIKLSNNNLRGSIPKQLGHLKHLRELYLDHNQLSGEIPKELGLMTSLEVLGLSSNQLEGEVPPQLGLLTKLRWLSIAENKLTGSIPKGFVRLKKLERLSLSRNQLEGALPAELSELSMLEAIQLEDNNFSGEIPPEWGRLGQLDQLELGRNHLTGGIPKELGKLLKIRVLRLDQNQLTGSIPKELGDMKSIRFLALYQNYLTGAIPVELSKLQHLEHLPLFHNRLSGEIPPQLGKLKALQTLALYKNRLHGHLPLELAELSQLRNLWLGQNALEGGIPAELGKLQHLQMLELDQNQLTGQIPKELGELNALIYLKLNENRLSGSIPPELGQLVKLQVICLEQNQLRGQIPTSFGRLIDVTILRLENNQLTGEIGSIWQLQKLQDLYLGGNRLRGEVPRVLHMQKLTHLDLSRNLLSGELPRFDSPELEFLDLSDNLFVGPLAESVESLCHSCKGFSQLRLSQNHLTGALPPCLFEMEHLTHLALSDNHLTGSIPKIYAKELVVLALHDNFLSGSIPHSLQSLQHLAVLTLHENSLDGQISDFYLTGPCTDSPSFRVRGASCFDLAIFFHRELDSDRDCEAVLSRARYSGEELESIMMNCPRLCNRCERNRTARATFHHNRFSCEVPAHISKTSDIHATVVMGNMVGHGRELDVSWISAEENQAFLYYSPKIWSDQMFVMCALLALGLCASLCRKQLGSGLQHATRSLATGSTSRVAASNLALLRVAACTTLLCSPLLLIFLAGTGYYMCAPPLSEITIANLREDPWAEFLVVVFWCLASLLSHTVVASMPAVASVKSFRHAAPSPTAPQNRRGTIFSFSRESYNNTWQLELQRATAWLLWIVTVSLFSLPSILFAVAQALPAHNTSGLSEEVLGYVHPVTPFLIVAIDMFLASPLSNIYSSWSGIKADRLLMTFRLFAAWLLSLLTTVFLHENCFGGWKWFWIVCKEDSPEHHAFNWRIWNETILDASKDMCQLRERWWAGGRCSRSIVEGLNTLMLKKLLIRCTVQPIVLLLLWNFSRLEPAGKDAYLSGRHLRLFWGKGPKMTGSLVPVQQMALVTTFLEILFFWSPLIPLLSVGVLCVATANLFLFDVGIWSFKVQMPTDVVNQQAALSRSYLTLTLAATCGFQLWHAYGTQMFGRHLLLLNLAILLPVKRWMLPLERARSFFWAEMERATEAEVIEMAIQMDLS
ncbi:unnamed protein product [Cladocopium goreaui]|uniref:LRR receptor-like serine/threonine-protein kinase FLS2 n=1 Tax=Cladocopium goreaui TaxID=2562237 RepID=A0A9P1C3V5_9DINO|nr:unnamed protein product [Cladocopium goreaui]